MIPIVSIVGKSDSGKTTLLEKVLPLLSEAGLRVCTVKHDAHGFEMDHEGKDSWRHARAGARGTAVLGRGRLGMTCAVEEGLTLDELALRLFPDADLVLTEGFKKGGKPKIEVYRHRPEDPGLAGDPATLLAVVSDDLPQDLRAGYEAVPVLSPGDPRGVADLLLEYRRRFAEGKGSGVHLLADGCQIPLNPFPAKIFRRTLRGMVSALDGADPGKRILLDVRGDD